MNSGQFTNTSSHMVQEVTNIIDGYKMGSMRALAQEPVQNAMDAKREGKRSVAVEYRLLQRKNVAGDPCFLLTVSDSGTNGLRGPMVDDAELQARNFKLKPEENWAAFEAQGYTKENEDALGSRGQGKAAFLYHSDVPGETRRMVMLYDTLLEDGEYRLGLRFARPVDQILTPPLYDDDAKKAIQSATYPLEDRLQIPLGLESLQEIGTRVIVPFLSDDDANNVRPGGELCYWLQRCWWRAIQLGNLQIRVVDDDTGAEQTIEPPAWWQDLPRVSGKPAEDGTWRDVLDGGRACLWGDIAFGDGHRIRRMALLHSDSLHEDEIVGDHPEYAGIQILRGSQWIETRGARQDFGDSIPKDKRSGFRGFVEFHKQTDSLLRAAENSQHDGFDARGNKGEIVRELRKELANYVRVFSDRMGWEPAASITSQQVSQHETATHTRLLETFLNPNGGKRNPSSTKGEQEGTQLRWECRLEMQYPDPTSARVDWGQSLRHVHAVVGVEPSEDVFGSADVVLKWVDVAGNAREICRREVALHELWDNNRVEVPFGDWHILRGKANREGQIACHKPGDYQLRTVIEYRGKPVKSAARTVYVQTEPPPPPPKNPVTLSISAANDDDGAQKRIDHGQVLRLEIFGRNRTPQVGAYLLTARLESEILAREMRVELGSTPAGDTAIKRSILAETRQLLDPHQNTPLAFHEEKPLVMPESTGIFHIRAELTNKNGEVVANASCPVYFQRDPGNAKNNLPFEIKQKDQEAMWELNEDRTILTYPRNYPLYSEMKEIQRQRRALQGRLAFIAEISANGLLEWAMRPKDEGDDSYYDQLFEDSGSQDDTLWERYIRRLEKLGNGAAESPIEYLRAWRETVAVMLEIFAKENN